MNRRIAPVALISAGLLVALSVTAAQAADVQPAKSACSNGAEKYACLTVATASAPVGATVTFTGKLSSKAMKDLKSWTAGANDVCLDRYATKPGADGSWGGTQLEGACAKVSSKGTFTINAEFGRVGAFDYGVSMGPCRATAAECGNGDPGLVGVAGPTVVRHRTTA